MNWLSPAGPGGMVAPGRVVAAGRWDSAPIRRAARTAKAEGRLIDLTYGHACKWVLFLDSGHVVLATAIRDTRHAGGEKQDGQGKQDRRRGEIGGGGAGAE